MLYACSPFDFALNEILYCLQFFVFLMISLIFHLFFEIRHESNFKFAAQFSPFTLSYTSNSNLHFIYCLIIEIILGYSMIYG